MASRRNVLMERFFTALISGDRPAARAVVDDALEADCAAEKIISNLYWPTLNLIQKLHREDQLSSLSYHYATRLLKQLVDQMQLRLTASSTRDEKVLVVCGPEPSEEIAAQMVADMLEADGYTVFFAGGGIAQDEIVAQVGELSADRLVVFGACPQTVPMTRKLIDHLHGIGVCPDLQIIVGGGVFNRADGLAEEIGADLWANEPAEIIEAMADEPQRRMSADQRTVGRKRRKAA